MRLNFIISRTTLSIAKFAMLLHRPQENQHDS